MKTVMTVDGLLCFTFRPFGSLGDKELKAASLALASIDNIFILGQNDLNDVVMRAGMGWEGSLGSKRWRWCVNPLIV